MKKMIAAALLALAGPAAAAAQAAAPPADLKLWRLGCGDFTIKQYGAFFSDTFQYPKGPKKVVGSCYLIKHGSDYLLWDTGLTDRLVGQNFETPMQMLTVERSIVDQLKQIGVAPAQIGTVGISHYHADHTGQAPHFQHARLLIGKGDWDAVKTGTAEDLKSPQGHLSHWLSGAGNSEPVAGDLDVYKDGSVVMLSLPGHTPGHHALLVRLASGPVLLSGDQYHFTEQVKNRGVPPFNTSRAETLASHDRFDRIAANLKAKVVIQHEPRDIAKLPAFPKAAE
jgi:glyoxylase-like metal-dependent hydrolase (beta-lactamase superfamily II)